MFEPQASAGTRNLTFGAPGRGALESFFHRVAFRRFATQMSSNPAANADHWAAWPAHAMSPSQGDLNLAPQAARAPQGDAGRGRRGQASSTLTPLQVRAAARAASHAAATAPHSRREQANMRATLTVARELLRCRHMESG